MDTGRRSSGDPAQLLLIRHGQSLWNQQRRWQGSADPPLTDEGRAQAVAAAEMVGSVDGIWASDLQRAAESAEIIAAQLGVGPVQLHPGLREAGIGPWQGLTVEEIDEGWPGYRLEGRRPAGAEDGDLVERRLLSAVRHIAHESTGQVLVVTHAGCLYAIRRSLGLSFIRYGNLAGFHLSIDRSGALRIGDSVALIQAEIPESL